MSVILPIIGIAMLILKWQGYSFFAYISWWWCAVPFVLAFIFWEFIDPFFQFSARRNANKNKRREEKLKKQYTEEILSDEHYQKSRKKPKNPFHSDSD